MRDRARRAVAVEDAQPLVAFAQAALDPRQVLERGYAWLEDEQGRPVTRAADTRPGQALAATLAD